MLAVMMAVLFHAAIASPTMTGLIVAAALAAKVDGKSGEAIEDLS